MTLFNFFKKNKNTNKINKDNFSENGLNEIYFTNGTGLIKERFFKKKGLIDGLLEEWYENGNIKHKFNYKEGNQVGKSYTYDHNGVLIREAEIKQNKYVNEIKEFYKNGNLRMRIIISNDNKKADEYLLYNTKGIIKTKLYFIRKNINESIWEMGLPTTLKLSSWNVEAEQDDTSNLEKLLPDLRNPIWTSYDSLGNKKLEVDFSATFPVCFDNKTTQQYIDSGIGVCELREYNKNSELITRTNNIIIQVDLSLFINTTKAILDRRRNESQDLNLITSNLALDSSNVKFFENILQLENFSSLHYLRMIIKEDALAKYDKVKEQRNWIKGFDILCEFPKTIERMANVPYYFEDGEEDIPSYNNLLKTRSYTKSHVIINTLNEMDCMQFIHHTMILNGGSSSFAKYKSEDAEFDCIYRNQIIRINKFSPKISKLEIHKDSPEIDCYNGGIIIDLLPPKNFSIHSTIPRGIHFDSEDINKVLLGLNKPVYCALEGGVGDGRFAVVKDNESSMILSHNEEFQILDYKNIIRHFSKENEILNLEDQEIKILLDSSDLLSKDIKETATIVSFKGKIREEDTVLCFTIKDKLMISMYKDYERYSIRIDKLIDSDWKDLRINKKDKFKFFIRKAKKSMLNSNVLQLEKLKDINLKITELYQAFKKKIKETDDGIGESLNYWYDIVKKMSLQYPLEEDSSYDLQIKESIYGNYDEYKRRDDLIDATYEELEAFARMRIFGFGEVYSRLILLDKKINKLLSDNSIKKHKVSVQLKNEMARAKARTYGAIKYALSVDLPKSKIKEWFPAFVDDKELIEGINPMDSVVDKYNIDLLSTYEMEIEENLILKKIAFIFQTMFVIATVDGDETPQERKFLEVIITDLYKLYDFNDSIPQAEWIHSEKDDVELLIYHQILIDKLTILEKRYIISLMGDVALCDDTFTYTVYGAILNTCVKLGVKHNKELFNDIDEVETKIIEKHPSKFDKKTLKEYKSILLSKNDESMGYIMAEKFIYEKENAKNRRTS